MQQHVGSHVTAHVVPRNSTRGSTIVTSHREVKALQESEENHHVSDRNLSDKELHDSDHAH